MESKKINQLATELTPSLSDLTIIGDPSTGISKKITLSQMASLFTGTVEEYASLAAFPLVGVADTIYIALDTNVLYRWDTGLTSYVELSPNIINSLVFSDANGFDGNISLVGSVATLTITTALTTGSVPFIGASGALSQDNANLFFDDTNNRLGINTNSPTTALDVFGSGIIGRVNGTSTNNAFLGFASAGSNKWSVGNVQSDHRFRIYNEAATSELFTILPTGEIGIGIANPFANLHIDGGASINRVIMDANINVAKIFSFRSDNSPRWAFRVDGTESGSNAGADFAIRRYTDAGAFIDAPLSITRSTGNITFGTGMTYDNVNSRLGINNSSPLVGLDVATTDAIKIPVGNNEQRPTGANGYVRFNTITKLPEWYDATIGFWRPFGSASFYADLVIVAGGGGGGNDISGGGGAGGMIVKSDGYSLSIGASYTITLGAGGAQATSGSNSIAFGLVSIGGGKGGEYAVNNAGSGGSGGGGGGQSQPGAAGTSGQGNNGGAGIYGGGSSAGGGGGGANATGGNAGYTSAGIGGNGGNGLATTISGSSITYAGGGGGGQRNFSTSATGGTGGGGAGGNSVNNQGQSGTANTGGGAGGHGSGGNNSSGGSGIIVIKLPNSFTAVFSSGITFSLSTSVLNHKVYTVTAGTGTVSFY
jgi:hypothetical protein